MQREGEEKPINNTSVHDAGHTSTSLVHASLSERNGFIRKVI